MILDHYCWYHKKCNPLPQATNEKNFSVKIYSLADCNLDQDVGAIKLEINWLDPLMFKIVGKMSHPIIKYHVESH